MPGTIVRTYELFDIRWDRGSTWTAYNSADEAQATIDGCPGEIGTVVRRTWEVTITPDVAHIYRPGVSDRPA